MKQKHITLRKSIEVISLLNQKGFTEKPEQITNTEADEEFMVLICKDTKTFNLIDHQNLMTEKSKNNIILTQ